MAVRKTTGPVSPKQRMYLGLLADGFRQGEVAAQEKVTPSVISAEVRTAAYRMRARTAYQAVAQYAQYRQLVELAQMFRRAATEAGEDSQISGALHGFAADVEALANRLLP